GEILPARPEQEAAAPHRAVVGSPRRSGMGRSSEPLRTRRLRVVQQEQSLARIHRATQRSGARSDGSAHATLGTQTVGRTARGWGVPAAAGCGDCSMSERRGKWKRPPMTLKRLMETAIPEPNSGCILWLGAINKFGYGRASINGQRTVAHRIAYTLTIGPISEGLELDHIC